MDSLKELAEIEIRSIQDTEEICRLVVKKLEDIFNVTFIRDLPNGSKLNYLNIITTILLIPNYEKYRSVLLDLLEMYNVNKHGLFFHLIGVINQVKLDLPDDLITEERKKLIKSLSNLPYFENTYSNDKVLSLNTEYGKITVFSYDKIINNDKLYRFIKSNSLAKKCHSAVEQLRFFFKDSYIITSEIPCLFSGIMYHSYISTKDGTVDISNNSFYLEDDFNIIYNPKEILKVETEKISESIKEVDIENYAPVLALALSNKRKDLKVS